MGYSGFKSCFDYIFVTNGALNQAVIFLLAAPGARKYGHCQLLETIVDVNGLIIRRTTHTSHRWHGSDELLRE